MTRYLIDNNYRIYKVLISANLRFYFYIHSTLYGYVTTVTNLSNFIEVFSLNFEAELRV